MNGTGLSAKNNGKNSCRRFTLSVDGVGTVLYNFG